MAERIEGPYDFSRYGFARYADGATWILTHGEDYHVNGSTVVTNARKWGREVGYTVDARVLDCELDAIERVALRFTWEP